MLHSCRWLWQRKGFRCTWMALWTPQLQLLAAQMWVPESTLIASQTQVVHQPPTEFQKCLDIRSGVQVGFNYWEIEVVVAGHSWLWRSHYWLGRMDYILLWAIQKVFMHWKRWSVHQDPAAMSVWQMYTRSSMNGMGWWVLQFSTYHLTPATKDLVWESFIACAKHWGVNLTSSALSNVTRSYLYKVL